MAKIKTRVVVDTEVINNLLTSCEDLLNELGVLETNLADIKDKVTDIMDELEEITYDV